MKKIRPGINRSIICKRCGHKIGVIRLRWRFKFKMIALGLLIAFVLQIPAQIVADIISKYVLGY